MGVKSEEMLISIGSGHSSEEEQIAGPNDIFNFRQNEAR